MLLNTLEGCSLLPSLKHVAILLVSATPLHQMRTTATTLRAAFFISLSYSLCVTCREGATCSTPAVMLNATSNSSGMCKNFGWLTASQHAHLAARTCDGPCAFALFAWLGLNSRHSSTSPLNMSSIHLHRESETIRATFVPDASFFPPPKRPPNARMRQSLLLHGSLRRGRCVGRIPICDA